MTKRKKNSDNVLEKVKEYITRFVSFPYEREADVISLWVLHTWAFHTAKTTPYIYVYSPEKQSGKSRLIEVLASLVRNPMQAIDMTGPVLFRAIDQIAPTVLLDEVDVIWSGAKNEGLRGIINGGYKLGGHVWRLAQSEPVQFNTFCPKLLAGIHNGYLPDTIIDRCIPMLMRRKKVGTEVEPFYIFENEEEVEALMGEIEQWVMTNEEALKKYPQDSIEGLSDRESEIAWPLLAVAEQFGLEKETEQNIVEMVTDYHESLADTDEGIQYIRAISELFEEFDRKRIHTAEILMALNMDRNQGKTLSNILDSYDIHPDSVRVGTRVAKGYTFEQFERVFDANSIVVTFGGNKERTGTLGS